MTWIDILWLMLAAACLTLALVYALVWLRHPARLAYLFFAAAAAGAAAMAGCEIAMMKAATPADFAAAQRAGHVAIFVVIVGLVAFIRSFFGTGRLWLAYVVCILRLVVLVANFSTGVSVNYLEISSLQQAQLWGGASVSVAEAVTNPWTRLAAFSLVAFFIYVIDASIALWRRGEGAGHRRAALVGGSTALVTLVVGIHATLVHEGVIHSPYIVAPAFFIILCAMAYELGSDVARAAQLDGRLHESETRFHAMADASPVMVWMSGADKRCTFFNKGWLEFTGRTMEQELGDGWAEGVHAEDRARCLQAYGEAFDARREFALEYRLRRRNGEYRCILDTGVPRFAADGAFLGYVGSCYDITERVRMEQETAEQRSELAHLSRVAMLGELSGSLAHELNQPLMAILSNAKAAQRFLADGTASINEVREILRDIVEDDKRAGEIIRRFRAFLRKDELPHHPLDVNEVVRDSLRLMRSDLSNRNLAASAELAPNLPAVEGDPVQLQQVLLNLMINACDSMDGAPAPGRGLVVRTRLAGEGHVEVSVSDQGKGIEPESLARIFEPFVTAKPLGMGLGLAVCRSIVRAHGGRIWAANNPGGGATVSFNLPVDGAAGS